MKKIHFIGILALTLSMSACSAKNENTKESGSPIVLNLYLGQEPPGSTPRSFAPNMVTTTGWEYGGSFTPDLKEFYFLREVEGEKRQELVVFQLNNSEWRESVVSPRVGQPVISPDGKTMHLGRRYKVRIGNEWSEVKDLGAPFADMLIMRLSAAANGTYYFDTFDRENLASPIRYSRLIDGAYGAPQTLGKPINTGTHLNHPFIAPDESYLIWDAKREGGFGDSDIYISFRKTDGSWGAATNLGSQINTSAWEAAASVTPDGKYLFFNRNMGSDDYENVDIFWVDAQVIEDLRSHLNQ